MAAQRNLMPGLGMVAAACLTFSTGLRAQRPSIPPQAIVGPALDYVPVEMAQALAWPADIEIDQVASAAADARGHLFVLNRGRQALLEFDGNGAFIRAFGTDLFERAHSLTIDADGYFWVTDVAAHVVVKLDREARVLLRLGTPGEAGNWNEAEGARAFDQPTDVALGPAGEIFVSQGHSRGEPRILKFDATGRFLTSWGGRGALPWQFAVAHSIATKDGLVYVADRENRRILVFDLDGQFVRGWVFKGMACSLDLSDERIFMTTGFDAQVVELDYDGHVLGVTGRPGEGVGEFGEAHDLLVTNDAIYVADVINRRLQKYVRAQK